MLANIFLIVFFLVYKKQRRQDNTCLSPKLQKKMIFTYLCLLLSACCFGETRTIIAPENIEDEHYSK